jgi:hypothetical protein
MRQIHRRLLRIGLHRLSAGAESAGAGIPAFKGELPEDHCGVKREIPEAEQEVHADDGQQELLLQQEWRDSGGQPASQQDAQKGSLQPHLGQAGADQARQLGAFIAHSLIPVEGELLQAHPLGLRNRLPPASPILQVRTVQISDHRLIGF